MTDASWAAGARAMQEAAAKAICGLCEDGRIPLVADAHGAYHEVKRNLPGWFRSGCTAAAIHALAVPPAPEAGPMTADAVAEVLWSVPEECKEGHLGWRGPGPYTGSHSGCLMGPNIEAMAQAIVARFVPPSLSEAERAVVEAAKNVKTWWTKDGREWCIDCGTSKESIIGHLNGCTVEPLLKALAARAAHAQPGAGA